MENEPCCGFCFGIGQYRCSYLYGCWNAPAGRSEAQKEAELLVLAFATLPESLKKDGES